MREHGDQVDPNPVSYTHLDVYKRQLWDSADQANYAVQNELGDLISAEAEKHGLHVIGYLESGFRDVFSKKMCIRDRS